MQPQSDAKTRSAYVPPASFSAELGQVKGSDLEVVQMSGLVSG